MKALYRRGTALTQVGKLEAAEDDLREAEKHNPGGELLPFLEFGDHCYCADKLVKQQIETVRKKKLEQQEKEKKMYAAMFSSN